LYIDIVDYEASDTYYAPIFLQEKYYGKRQSKVDY